MQSNVNEQTNLLPVSVHNNNQNNKKQCSRCILCTIVASITVIYVCYFLLLANAERVIDIVSKHIPTYDYSKKCIHPGCNFLDTQNKPINAHGGGILYYNNTYYWYGEIKVGSTYLPSSNAEWGGTRVDLTGISCYSSRNLVNWEYLGNVLPAVTNESSHDLYIDKVAERPKVVYNERSDKFVMWLHVDSMDYSRARCGVATSNRPEGPFQYIKSFRPNGQMARDLTVFVDDDLRAYLFTSSEDNAAIHISELSDDYLSTSESYSTIFVGRYMEAPTIFKRRRDGKYYFIGSGCTAWKPNDARSAVASSILGPWKELGNPCRGKDANTTFYSQSTYVLPVSGSNSDRFIFMADRWNEKDLSDSRYTWLPLSFDEATDDPIIQWHDHWSPVDLFRDDWAT